MLFEGKYILSFLFCRQDLLKIIRNSGVVRIGKQCYNWRYRSRLRAKEKRL